DSLRHQRLVRHAQTARRIGRVQPAHPVVRLVRHAAPIPSKPEIQRKAGGDLPVVLKVWREVLQFELARIASLVAYAESSRLKYRRIVVIAQQHIRHRVTGRKAVETEITQEIVS